MSKHTPGPWDARNNPWEDGDPDNWYVLGKGEDVVASGLPCADARLIAAAPDLLALLKRHQVAAWCEEDSDLAVETRAAIAKAEGGS